jgi:Uncharacterized conserved protein
MADKQGYTTIDEYIATFPNDIQQRMNELRTTIKEQAPDAIEKISWAMPTFWQNGNLVHFAGFKNHIGFYPGAGAIQRFAPQMQDYKTSKGAVQFPHSKPMPLELVREIVRFRVAEQG